MDLTDALILGIVEGLTEFIPVSSTGHLILAGSWLHLGTGEAGKAAIDAFDIVIQAGAWLACCWYYAPLLIERVRDLRSQEPVRRSQGMRLGIGLAVAFVPVVLVGLLLRKKIKLLFFGPGPVAVALAVGGIAMIAADLWIARRARLHTDAGRPLVDLSLQDAGIIGAFQCFSLMPGTSRSMATMVGGLFSGLDRRAAADFSFLLAIPVLGAATAYELMKEGRLLLDQVGILAMTVGLLASFLVGWASIAGFVRVISKSGLVPFGIYRIVMAVVVYKVLL